MSRQGGARSAERVGSAQAGASRQGQGTERSESAAILTSRAGQRECVRFPHPGDDRLWEGMSRNFQVFDALEFLAAMPGALYSQLYHEIESSRFEALPALIEGYFYSRR